jgi:hypothetical protein
MHRSFLIFSLSCLTLAFSHVQAQQIVLDDVMSQEEQQKTGVSNLSLDQKVALEAWLNKTFAAKIKEKETEGQLSLSINIDNGQKLQLSDNSIWEVNPNDVPTAAVWIIPFPVKIVPSNDPEYPSLIVNLNSGVSVKAKMLPKT